MSWKDEFPKENRYFETENGILYFGDSFEILKKFPKNSVDLVVADPQYDIPSTNVGGSLARSGFKETLKELKNTGLTKSSDIETIVEMSFRILKTINAYFWCNKTQLPRYFKIREKYDTKFELIKWIKTNAPPSYYNKYKTDTEYCFYFRKNAYCNPENNRDGATYFFTKSNTEDKKLYNHPTIKPIHIIWRLVKNSSIEQNIIVDPFVGSGTTAVVCEKLNRRWLVVDINEKYCKTSMERIKNEINQTKLF